MEQNQTQSTPHDTKSPSKDGQVSGDRALGHDIPHEKGDRKRLLAGCAYLGVLFLIPLLMDHKDEFVRFHLRQGMALFALGSLASFGFHYRGGSFLTLVVVIISLVGAFRAWRGDKWVLPVIGKYAAKIEL